MTPFSNAFRDADVNFDDWDAKFGLSDREKVRRRRRDVSKKRRTYRTTLADRETQNTRALSGERKAVKRRTLSARRQEDNRLDPLQLAWESTIAHVLEYNRDLSHA